MIVSKGEDDKPLKPVDSSGYNFHLLSSLRMHGDDEEEEELQMLASLKREQEEDERRASGLSASQIHQCNVSISMSIDDASTWTHISMVCTILLLYSWSSSVDSSLTSDTHVQLICYSQSLAGCTFFCLSSGIIFFDPGWSSPLLIFISSH